MARKKRVSLNALLERKAQALRDQLAAVERLLGNPDFVLVSSELEDLEDEPLPAKAEARPGQATTKPTRPRKQAKPKQKKPDSADKRGTRGDAIRQVIKQAGDWLTGEQIRDRLPSVGYTPAWGNPYANVKALIQEEQRKGVTRIVLRDAKFGLAEWADHYPGTGNAPAGSKGAP